MDCEGELRRRSERDDASWRLWGSVDSVDTDAFERAKSRPASEANTEAGTSVSLSQQQHATALAGVEQHDCSAFTLSTQHVWQH